MRVGEGIILAGLALLLIVGTRPKIAPAPRMAEPKALPAQPALLWLQGRGASL